MSAPAPQQPGGPSRSRRRNASRGAGGRASGELARARERFIDIWGQMGSKWGIPRTMAEVHALLFIEGRPLNTDEVMQRLRISRGNASMTLRALADWSLVRRTHLPGDRKEYYLAEQDVWKMFRTIVRERKKREIDPLLEALRDCRAPSAVPASPARPRDIEAASAEQHNRRLDELLNFMHLFDALSQRFISPTGEGLDVAARILSKAS